MEQKYTEKDMDAAYDKGIKDANSQTEQLKSKIDRDKEVTQANELVLLDRIKELEAEVKDLNSVIFGAI